MKQFSTFLLLLSLATATLFANPVEPEKALKRATEFWNSKNGGAAKLTLYTTDEIQKAGSRVGETADKAPQYYLFVPEDNKGFVIVSGEDKLSPLVGYSTTSFETAQEMPAALLAWLDEYSNYVDDVRENKIGPVITRATAKGSKVEPMLTTSWNQSAPYNDLCPEISGRKAPTGCTATAMAQIMKFHEWPEKPKASINWYNNITQKDEYINIRNNVYEWEKMLPHYRGTYTAEEANAVAQLMVDVGKAIQSNYALEGTGSSEIYVSHALVNVFDYSPDAMVLRRSETTEDEFVAIIRENLEARQPVLFTGQGQSFSSGHAFVCDGIDENNLLHIDWGWDGSYNGYFDMTYMQPAGTGTGGGSGRYNVAQAIVANIRPRDTGEANRIGDPTMYYTTIYDPNDTAESPAEINEYVTNVSTGTVGFKIGTFFINWSHSSVNTNIAIAFEESEGVYYYDEVEGANLSLAFNKTSGYYLTFSYDLNGIEQGTHNIKICYKNNSGEYVPMPGENNLQLVLDGTKVTLRKATPQVELADINYIISPMFLGDRLSFTAEFINRNNVNSTILVVPVLNTQQPDGTYTSRVISDNAAVIDVYDNRNIYVEFITNERFKAVGNYYISFVYNMRSYYTDHSKDVDYDNLLTVEGKGDVLAITKFPEGPVPSVASMSASNVSQGKKMSVSATISNISRDNSAYTGTLGLFVKSHSTGEELLLEKYNIEKLAQGSSVTLSYNSTGFFPKLTTGKYSLFFREQKNGWSAVKHSTETCIFSVLKADSPILYAADVMEINNGKVVVQGNGFDVKAKLAALNGDFDGYVKVSVTSGITAVIKSEYIPVSVKEGEITDVTIPCTCAANTKLGLYNMSIVCYDSDKKRIGYLSNNDLTIAGNGEFWVGDATAIEEIDGTEATVYAADGNIHVCGTKEGATITVYSVDGNRVYNGTATTIAVEKGLYVVCIESPTGGIKRIKVAAGN